MVRTRVAWGLSLTAGFVIIAWLDSRLVGGPLFHILVGIAMVGGLLEFYGLAERQGGEPVKLLPVALIVCFVVADYAARAGELPGFGEPLPRTAASLGAFYAPMGAAAVFGVWSLALTQLLARAPQRWLAGAPVAGFGLLYVWFLAAHLFAVRGMGMGYAVAALAAAKLGDVGAYSAGTRWGRHRLAPRVSPNKTIEGALGGLATSVGSALLAAVVFGLEGGTGFWILFGAVVGAAAQVGDLVASALKRSAGAKDSGRLLPTFGGVLDVIDSPLFSAPVALWLLVA